MLTGQNGILTNATNANSSSVYHGAEEQVKLAYMSVRTQIMTEKVANSSYDARQKTPKNNLEALKDIVIKDLNAKNAEINPIITEGFIVGLDETDETKPVIKITYKNAKIYQGTITGTKPSENGKIEFEIGLLSQDSTLTIDGVLMSETDSAIRDKDGKPIALSKIAEYYGHDVTYNGKKYQLFMVDRAGKYSNGEPRIWLQYKTYVSGIKLSDHYETTGIATAGSILWQVNPDLDSAYGNTIRARTSWNANMQGVAFLCNPERWNTEYVGTDGEAAGAYAIGVVSVEMYCDSYNQAKPSNVPEFSAKAYNENGTYGYRYKPAHANSSPNSDGYGYYTDYTNYEIKASTASSIYRINNRYPWLASPSTNYNDRVCMVYGNDGSLRHYYAGDAYGVRPAVSLPSGTELRLEN